MNAIIIEEARKLSGILNLYSRQSRFDHLNEQNEVRNELEWNAPYFYADVLFQAEENDFYFINKNKLLTLQNIFNERTNGIVDANQLICDEWLRIVYGGVRIPSVISEAARITEKFSQLKSELTFLIGVQKTSKTGGHINKDEFQQLASDYQAKHQLHLDLGNAAKNHLWRERDGVIAIENICYYEPLLAHWSSLQFIRFVYEHLYVSGNRNELQIEAVKLQAIVSKYYHLFPQTPPLSEMVRDGQFSFDDSHYTIQFTGTHGCFDKTAGVLWERILANNTFSDDATRLLFWFKRIIHRSSWIWSDIGKFISGQSLSRFINAATEAVIADSDLSFGQDEFRKLLLDPRDGNLSGLAYLRVALAKDTFPIHDDLYELYWHLCVLDENYQDDLIYYQSVRQPLAYLIRQIVKYGAEVDDRASYSAVFRLLDAGNVKSYLLWEVCQDLKEAKATLIPALLLREQTAALAFSLLWEVPISEHTEDVDKVRLKLLTAGFRLLLDGISAEHLTDEKKAKIVFQALLCAVTRKYRIHGQAGDQQNVRPSVSEEVFEELSAVFVTATEQQRFYIATGRGGRLLFPHLLKHLFTIAKEFTQPEYRRNHILELPLVKLNLFSWLLELRLSKDYTQSGITDELRFEITEAFVEAYTEVMNTTEMDGWDSSISESMKKQPLWSNQSSLVELVPWHRILAFATPEALHFFLRPSQLTLKNAEDRYDVFNRFTADKIRTHIFILIEAYNGLYKEATRLKANGIQAQNILSAIETAIVTFVTHHHVDEPGKRRIDLFDDLFEAGYASTGGKRDLLAGIGSVMNKFTKEGKLAIVQELPKAKQLKRALKLLEYVSSEGDRQLLLSTIKAQDITDYLANEHSSIDSIQFILQELAKTPELIGKAREAIAYWNTAIVKRGGRGNKVEHQIIAYRVELLIAYHEEDESAMNAVREPVLTHSSVPFFAEQEKDFYRALLFLKVGKPALAYDIFDQQLHESNTLRPVLALNRFAAKLSLADAAEDVKEKCKLFQEGIDEWQAFEKRLPNETNIGFLVESIGYNKLHAYEGLRADASFDAVYHSLEKSVALRVDFLEFRLKNLVRRGMQTQADQLFQEAQDYHRLRDGRLPDYVSRLAAIIETEDAIVRLREQYRIILSKSPEKLVAIIPENVNKYDTLQEAILSEIVYASNQMLIHMNSLHEIVYEDKYSDLLQLVLNARLSMYGWRSSLTRGGQPYSGKANLGEIDFAIFSKGDRLCLCEAMILKGQNTIESQKHNFKIFNYDHSRKLFFVLIYYKGGNYKADWEQYKSDLGKLLSFPDGYEMQFDKLQDLTADFGNESIRVGKGAHGQSTTLYHIFININYFVAKS